MWMLLSLWELKVMLNVVSESKMRKGINTGVGKITVISSFKATKPGGCFSYTFNFVSAGSLDGGRWLA